MTLGIGIVTYNRRDVLLGTLDAVLRHTRAPSRLLVADDGSTDGTVEAVHDLRIPVVTGQNAGVAWNKNRVLFALRGCDPIILLEDDTRPSAPGWEAPLADGARRWGHVNLAGDWFAHAFVSGAGTADDPILARETSGQCSAFSAEALAWVGYLDTRFKGYGFANTSSTRCASCGSATAASNTRWTACRHGCFGWFVRLLRCCRERHTATQIRRHTILRYVGSCSRSLRSARPGGTTKN